MACCLFGATPLSETMLTWCQLYHWEHILVKFCSKFNYFHSRKWNWKWCLQNGSHFVSASMLTHFSVQHFQNHFCWKIFTPWHLNFNWWWPEIRCYYMICVTLYELTMTNISKNELIHWAKRKWLELWRCYLQMHFIQRKFLYFNSNFI